MSSIQNNQPSFLKEYRCPCGKLLFKGLILVSVIEIKCKRCGATRLIHEIRDGVMDNSSFGILLDLNGSIVEASQNVERALGYELEYLLRKPLHEFCPALRGNEKDARPMCVRNAGKPFEIARNIFICRDGTEKPLESYFVCNYEGEKFSGYKMFNWLGKG